MVFDIFRIKDVLLRLIRSPWPMFRQVRSSVDLPIRATPLSQGELRTLFAADFEKMCSGLSQSGSKKRQQRDITIAEGVETQEQLMRLSDLGCYADKGYLVVSQRLVEGASREVPA
jgi:predicted signal transduction protein with EAL and GGDEF domain